MEDLLFSYADSSTPMLKRKMIRIVERATGQPRLKALYLDNQRNPRVGESFFQAAIRCLRLDMRFNQSGIDAIPREGPLVVVANHPYGVLDGLAVAWLVEKARKDFFILTNAVLLRAPEVRNHVLAIDFAGTPEALETNLRSRAAARDHLAKGGAVIVFPAGGVSTAPDKLGRRPAIDAPWQAFTAQLVQRSKATVVPMCFGGQNSRAFQVASHISASLRLSLIFHEVHSRIGTALPVAIGRPIPFAEIAHLKDRQAMADDLRARTYALAELLPGLTRGEASPGKRPPVKELPQAALASFISAWDAGPEPLRLPAWTRKLRRLGRAA